MTLPPTGSIGRAPLLMVTKTLLFAGSGYETEPAFRAYDKKTGATLGEVTLTGTPLGTPMTYLADGRQFVALTTLDGKLISLALPKSR